MVAALDRELPAVGRTGRALFLLTLGVYVLTAGGSLTSSDAVTAVDLTAQIVDHRSLALSGDLTGLDALRGADGRFYSPFGIVQSIWNVPFYVAGRAVTTATGLRVGRRDSLPKAFVAMSQTILGAVIVWLTYSLCAFLTRSRGIALSSAAILAFGSLLWPYARFGFNQPLACATLLAAVSDLITGTRRASPRRLTRAGIWLALAFLTRHELMLALPLFVAWLWRDAAPDADERRRRLTAFAPGVIAGGLFWLGYNWLRFGNPLDPGYLRDSTPGFGGSLVTGLLGLLISPGGSIFLYSPFVVLGVWGLVREWRGGDRATATLCLGLIGLFLLFYAQLGNWMGWRAYGPRYLVVVLPYAAIGLAFLLARLHAPVRRTVAVTAFLAGFVVQWPGVLMDYAKVSQSAAVDPASVRELRQWRWRESMQTLNAEAALAAVPANLRYLTGRETPPPLRRLGVDDAALSQQLSFSLDWWWLYLFYLGALPRTAVVVIVAAGITWIWLWAYRAAA